MALTPKQSRFVEEYLIDLNATQAAIRAGYAAKDADVQGPRLLGNVGVSAALAVRMAEKAEKLEITQDLVLNGLLAEARLTGKGSQHGARVTAWAKLGEHLKLFTQKIEHGGEMGLKVEQMTAAERKARAVALLDKAARVSSHAA